MRARSGLRQVCLTFLGLAVGSSYACSDEFQAVSNMRAPTAGEGGETVVVEPNPGGAPSHGGGEAGGTGPNAEGGEGGEPQSGASTGGDGGRLGAGGEPCTDCGGECVPGTKQCDPLGLGLSTCNAQRQWGAPVACAGLACPVGKPSCQGTPVCPGAKPVAGAACGSSGLLCAYGGSGCGCIASETGAKWSCSTPFACVGNCFNQTCVAANEMCTTESGRCQPVTCNDDADCCGLTACDNLTDRCSKNKSPYFTCAAGECVRATAGYSGVCKTLEPAIGIESTCAMPCPATAPANGKRCMPYQQSCTYGGKSCECNLTGANIGWQCTG